MDLNQGGVIKLGYWIQINTANGLILTSFGFGYQTHCNL